MILEYYSICYNMDILINWGENMNFRQAEHRDLSAIMVIIGQAQSYLKEKGVDQWQNNYPDEGVIGLDIKQGIGYVLSIEDCLVATAALSFDGESTYDKIYEGSWLNEEPYSVIHRIAANSSVRGRGVSSEMLKHLEKLTLDRKINNIRIDTHQDNLTMQGFLKKHGFIYCGVIYLKDGAKRVAYQKVL